MLAPALQLAFAFAAAAPPASAPVLVLDPAGDLDAGQRALVAQRLARALAGRGVDDVITVHEVRRLLRAEAERQELGCDDAGCAAEIAGAFGAGVVVVSELLREPGATTLTVELLDVRTARVLARGEASAHDLHELEARVDHAAAPLAHALAGDAAPPLAVIAWPVACAAGALAIAGAGAAFDVWAPSSRNHAFDVVDMVGPLAYAGAVGLGAAAFFNPFAE